MRLNSLFLEKCFISYLYDSSMTPKMPTIKNIKLIALFLVSGQRCPGCPGRQRGTMARLTSTSAVVAPHSPTLMFGAITIIIVCASPTYI